MLSYYQLKQVFKLLPYIRPFIKRTFSLMGEDNVILDFFVDLHVKGNYVDIGSGHPSWGSNTFLLYKKGWTGLLVDPIATNIRLSRRIRRKDIAICAGVGVEPKDMLFFELEPYEYSTFDEEIALNRINASQANLVSSYLVPILSFADLPLIHELDFTGPTFLNIDAEGFDLKILRTINFEIFPFALICVEEWESPLDGNTKTQNYLAEYGYRLIARLGTSSMYAKSRNFFSTL